MRVGIGLAMLCAVLLAGNSEAALTMTAAGTAHGFSLSTFASGFPVYAGNGAGPTGIAFLDTGVLVSDQPGNVRLFPSSADGQNAGDVPVIQNYGIGDDEGLVRVGSAVYMTQFPLGHVVQLNSSGHYQRDVASVQSASGIVLNPANGHLFVGSFDNNQIMDVDPVTGVVQVLASAPSPDGLVLSADGRTLYVAAEGSGSVRGFDTITGDRVYDSGIISGVVDGVALGAGTLSGKLFVNTNSGVLVEVDLATNAKTVIANGGSRGDFLTVDPTNDTLLGTQGDRIMRLHGGTFVPEPGSTGLGAVVGWLLLMARGRRG